MAYQQPPYGAPPPLHHQPYSNPGPTSPEQLPPHQQSAPVPYRSHSDYARGPGQHHPVPSQEFPYGSSPASHSGFHDSRLAPVPSGQPLPPQPHMLAPPAPGTVPSSQALMPSYAADMPQVYRSNSHGSHYSVPGGRGRSSSHASHTSHRSHKSSHSHTKKEKRPTMGDTLYLMWDSVWNAFSRRK